MCASLFKYYNSDANVGVGDIEVLSPNSKSGKFFCLFLTFLCNFYLTVRIRLEHASLSRNHWYLPYANTI